MGQLIIDCIRDLSRIFCHTRLQPYANRDKQLNVREHPNSDSYVWLGPPGVAKGGAASPARYTSAAFGGVGPESSSSILNIRLTPAGGQSLLRKSL